VVTSAYSDANLVSLAFEKSIVVSDYDTIRTPKAIELLNREFNN